MVNLKGYVKKVRNRHGCGRLPRILGDEENNNKRLFRTVTNQDSKKDPVGYKH